MAYEPSADDERRRIALEQAVAGKNENDDTQVLVDRAAQFYSFLEGR